MNPSLVSVFSLLALSSTRTPAALLAVARRREIATRDAPRVGRGRRPSPSDSDIFYIPRYVRRRGVVAEEAATATAVSSAAATATAADRSGSDGEYGVAVPAE